MAASPRSTPRGADPFARIDKRLLLALSAGVAIVIVVLAVTVGGGESSGRGSGAPVDTTALGDSVQSAREQYFQANGDYNASVNGVSCTYNGNSDYTCFIQEAPFGPSEGFKWDIQVNDNAGNHWCWSGEETDQYGPGSLSGCI
jgi:hypothetical protein